MTDKKDKALKKALGALLTSAGCHDNPRSVEAIKAIREALAEQPAQQEPVARVINKSIVWRPCDIAGLPTGSPLYTSPPIEATPLASQRSVKPWVGLDDTELDGYSKHDVLMVRHFERKLFERNTYPCLEGLPEPIRTPPEKGTEYWTIGLGQWTWGGTTHDYSCLSKGIWLRETDVWKVHAAIRRSLGIESNIAALLQNRHEAKLKEKNGF